MRFTLHLRPRLRGWQAWIARHPLVLLTPALYAAEMVALSKPATVALFIPVLGVACFYSGLLRGRLIEMDALREASNQALQSVDKEYTRAD